MRRCTHKQLCFYIHVVMQTKVWLDLQKEARMERLVDPTEHWQKAREMRVLAEHESDETSVRLLSQIAELHEELAQHLLAAIVRRY